MRKRDHEYEEDEEYEEDGIGVKIRREKLG